MNYITKSLSLTEPLSHAGLFLDKQQEVDINNLRLDEEIAAGRACKTVDGLTVAPPAPLSKISGVKKPLGSTNSFCGATLPQYGVEPRLEHEAELATVSQENH